VLFGVIIFADDGQFLHVEPRVLKFFDGRFGFGVGVINPYDCVVLRHDVSPC